ncbi:MAG TPA: hypothetical protein VL284_19655, partial [Thermoanaerobaculia bacterium]|nr:hypothetical protein [Thermoanaerobaculia bacterium]
TSNGPSTATKLITWQPGGKYRLQMGVNYSQYCSYTFPPNAPVKENCNFPVAQSVKRGPIVMRLVQ